MHRLQAFILGPMLAVVVVIVLGVQPAFATTCANVVTSDNSSTGYVDTSFPLGFALGEFIILMFVVGLILIRWTQTHGPIITKGNIFGSMITLQALIFLVEAINSFSIHSGLDLPPSSKDIVITSLGLSLGYTMFFAVIVCIAGFICLFRKSIRQKGRTIVLGSLLALLVLIPMYVILISTPHC